MHITFLFYEGMTALDAVGPQEVLARLPGAIVQTVSLTPGIINTTSGPQVIAEQPLSAVEKTDILLVPGGAQATSLKEYPEILNWIKKVHETTTWTTSVCTGSLILGAAGLLTGLKATTHWAVMDRLATWGAIPTQQRVVESGKIITAAGVSAGIDMALTLAAKIAGEQFAQAIQLGIEYDPDPPFNSGSPQKAPASIVNELRKRLMKKFAQD